LQIARHPLQISACVPSLDGGCTRVVPDVPQKLHAASPASSPAVSAQRATHSEQIVTNGPATNLTAGWRLPQKLQPSSTRPVPLAIRRSL